MQHNLRECAICGEKYPVCRTCEEVQSFKPWRTIVDTMEHYKIHIILSDYTNKRITKEDAKKMLLDCDIGDYKKFLPHIASVIDEIFKESKGVSAKTVSKKKEAEQVGECDNTNSE